jgi:gluconate kinase
MSKRSDHYFKADMLKSQFAALEEPDYGLILDIDLPLEEKIDTLVKKYS